MIRDVWPCGYFGPETVVAAVPNINTDTVGPGSKYLAPRIQLMTALYNLEEAIDEAAKVSSGGIEVWNRWITDGQGFDHRYQLIMEGGKAEERKEFAVFSFKARKLGSDEIVPSLNAFTLERGKRII